MIILFQKDLKPKFNIFGLFRKFARMNISKHLNNSVVFREWNSLLGNPRTPLGPIIGQ